MYLSRRRCRASEPTRAPGRHHSTRSLLPRAISQESCELRQEFDADGWNPEPLNLREGRGRTPAPPPRGSRTDPPPETASAVTGAARRAAAAADGGDSRRRSASCETRCMATRCDGGVCGPVGRKGGGDLPSPAQAQPSSWACVDS